MCVSVLKCVEKFLVTKWMGVCAHDLGMSLIVSVSFV